LRRTSNKRLTPNDWQTKRTRDKLMKSSMLKRLNGLVKLEKLKDKEKKKRSVQLPRLQSLRD
jgi:hypothetical protein